MLIHYLEVYLKKSTLFHVILLIALILSFISEVHAQKLSISVAASMTEVFKTIIHDFSMQNQDVTVHSNFGPSGGLAKQIYMGAPADVYISANPAWMTYLLDNSLVAKSSITVFAHNRLVLIGTKTADDFSMQRLTDLAKVGLGNPHNVPAGKYAQQALEQLGLYNKLLQQGKLVMAKDVRQALVYADRGETDCSFVYKSDAGLAASASILYEIPHNLHEPIRYPVALTTRGVNNPAAQRFFGFIRSKESNEILQRYGFIIPQS